MCSKANLTRGPVGWTLVRLTLPMIGGMFTMVTYHLADTYFVSRLDSGLATPRHLAAMGFTFPVMMVVMAVAIGLSHAVSSVVSRAIGEGDLQKVRRLTTDSILLSVLLVATVAAIGVSVIDPVFRLVGAREDVLPLIHQYMTIWFLGTPAVVVPIIGNTCLRADGNTKLPATIMLVSSLINVGLDPLLIFGLWGLPKMGIGGAALATVLARSCSMIASLYILGRRKQMLTFEKPRVSELLRSWKAVLYIAIPSAGTTMLFPLSMGVVTRLAAGAGLDPAARSAGDFGKSAVAAIGAGERVESFVMMVIWALSTTVGPFIGQNFGAGRMERVFRARRLTLGFSVVWGLACLGVFLVTGRWIAMAFGHAAEVERLMVWYLWLIAAGLGMRGVCVLANSFFNAINQPLYSAAVDITRLFALTVPLAYTGSKLFGVYGVFGGVAAANILAGTFAILLSGRLVRRRASQIDVYPDTAPPAEAEL